jgi:hypothetical protein
MVIFSQSTVDAVFVHEVHAAIATAAPDLPLCEEDEALLRAEIEVSDLPGTGILNGSAALTTDGTIASLAYTIQNQCHTRCLSSRRPQSLKPEKLKRFLNRGDNFSRGIASSIPYPRRGFIHSDSLLSGEESFS